MNFLFRGSTKGMFDGITQVNIKFSVNVKARGPFAACPHHEITLIIIEIWHIFPKKKRDLSAKVRIIFILASVGEDSFLFGMRM